MTKPYPGQLKWGQTLNDHLDSLATDIATKANTGDLTAKQDKSALDADVASKVSDTASSTGTAISSTYGKAKRAVNDVVRYVSVVGDDSNDGLSPGTAMATVTAAQASIIAEGGGLNNYWGTVYVGSGTFTEIVTVKNAINIIGNGSATTKFTPPDGSAAEGCFLLDTGPVSQVTLSGFSVVGKQIANQHGIYFKAVSQGPPDNNGGLWYGTLRNIHVSGFDGHGIWLRGGGDDYLIPHQFLVFERVVVQTTDASGSSALVCSGQVGQVDFVQCEFDSDRVYPWLGTSSAANVRICPTLADDGSFATGAITPYSLTFHTTTLQGGWLAAKAEQPMSGILFLNPHLENCHAGFLATTNASMIIDSGSFGNIGQGDGSGYWARAENADILVRGGHAGNVIDKTFTADGVGTITLAGAGQRDVSGTTTTNMTKQVSQSSGTLALGGARTAIVNASATQITTITGSFMPGELVHLRAFGGTITFATGGNLHLAGEVSPLTLADGQVATFTRLDVLGNVQLVSLI